MNAHICAIDVNDNLTKFISSTFGLGGKMPGSISAQTRVKDHIKEFLKSKQFNIDNFDLDIFSPSDQPFTCRIVVKGLKDSKSVFCSSVDVELKDVLEKVIETIPEPIQQEVVKPTEHKAIVVSSPDDKKSTEQLTQSKEPTPIKESIPEKDHYQDVIDKILEDDENTQEERHNENIVSIKYPHDVLVTIGKFINSVNLFNIGNMVFGDTITVAQTNTISEQIFEIMGHSDVIREYIPSLICDIGSSMDYRNGVFSIDVHVVLDVAIQKLTSDYVMSFKVIRK